MSDAVAGHDPRQVTFVIPVWGKAAREHLGDAVASLRAQDPPPEILIVDNADDPPLDIAGARIVRSGGRLSLGAARDLGLRHVETPMVCFWDADDVMPEGILAKMAERLERDRGLVACGATIIDGSTMRRHHWPRRWPIALSRWPTLFALGNAVNALFSLTGALMRTDAARDARFPDTGRGDDWVMGVSMAFRGRISAVDEPGRIYRRRDDSVSAGWNVGDALTHARLVRRRLRHDPAVPFAIRCLLPLVWLAHQGVFRGLRPVARLSPARRRAHT